MNRCLKYFFSVSVCIAFFLIGKAQDLDSLSSIILQDTVYQSTVSPNENYHFREASIEDKTNSRKVSDADLNKIKSEDDYWYINQVPPRKKQNLSPPQKGENPNKSRGLFNIPWLNVVFWIILIGGFITLLVWFLSTSDIRLFRKKPKQSEEQIQEESTDNIFEINFEKEIQKATDAKNYRMAVRMLYLRTLRDLSNRHLINYVHTKTNSDYLLQLAGTVYYKTFFRLTRSFDYTWYGQFEVSPESFDIIQNDFSSFKQQLS